MIEVNIYLITILHTNLDLTVRATKNSTYYTIQTGLREFLRKRVKKVIKQPHGLSLKRWKQAKAKVKECTLSSEKKIFEFIDSFSGGNSLQPHIKIKKERVCRRGTILTLSPGIAGAGLSRHCRLALPAQDFLDFFRLGVYHKRDVDSFI